MKVNTPPLTPRSPFSSTSITTPFIRIGDEASEISTSGVFPKASNQLWKPKCVVCTRNWLFRLPQSPARISMVRSHHHNKVRFQLIFCDSLGSSVRLRQSETGKMGPLAFLPFITGTFTFYRLRFLPRYQLMLLYAFGTTALCRR